MKHAETYSKLLTGADGKDIRLTKHDDEIYKQFKQDFPEIDVRNVKDHCAPSEKWDAWIAKWQDKVEDLKFGSKNIYLLSTKACLRNTASCQLRSLLIYCSADHFAF